MRENPAEAVHFDTACDVFVDNVRAAADHFPALGQEMCTTKARELTEFLKPFVEVKQAARHV